MKKGKEFKGASGLPDQAATGSAIAPVLSEDGKEPSPPHPSREASPVTREELKAVYSYIDTLERGMGQLLLRIEALENNAP